MRIKYYELAGILAPVMAFLGITLAVNVHSGWFSWKNNAISDLGRIGLEKNYILNFSLIIAGILGLIYAYGMYKETKGVLKKIGVGIFTAGLISLILIGAFPEGTSPHYYVSWGFYILASTGILVYGTDEIRKEKTKTFGIFSLLDVFTAWILGIWAIKTFKGAAIPELIGAVAIALWVYILIFWRSKLLSIP